MKSSVKLGSLRNVILLLALSSIGHEGFMETSMKFPGLPCDTRVSDFQSEVLGKTSSAV